PVFHQEEEPIRHRHGRCLVRALPQHLRRESRDIVGAVLQRLEQQRLPLRVGQPGDTLHGAYPIFRLARFEKGSGVVRRVFSLAGGGPVSAVACPAPPAASSPPGSSPLPPSGGPGGPSPAPDGWRRSPPRHAP